MFSSSSTIDVNTYDFFSEENLAKWSGLFIQQLNLVHNQVHPSLKAKKEALEYIERLIIQLLSTLCASEPHTSQDVEDRVQKTFPDPIDKWAIRDAERALDKVDNRNRKNPLVLPVDKIHPLLIKEVLGYRIDYTVTVYIVAVLEYIAADILKLTGNYVKNIKHQEITSQDIKVAICADQVLMDMFSQKETEESLPLVDEPQRRESLTYEDIVKDFILEENQYLHDLNMIIKVFRAPFAQLFPKSKDLDVIFSNILDIYTFTSNMLSSVEEQVEVAAEKETPMVGICFQDIAEGEEFSVYEKYVEDMLAPHGKERLNTLLQRTDISDAFQKFGNGFKDATKYVLPKLLLGPIYHCLHYFEVIKALTATSPDDEDRECLEQANGLLSPLKYMLENKFAGSIAKKKPCLTDTENDEDRQGLRERGNLLPEPVSLSGKPVLTIRVLKIGLKDAKQYIDPYISVYVKDDMGADLTTHQDTPMAPVKEDAYIVFNVDVHIQKTLDSLPPGYAIFFEFKHYKPKKASVSTRCWAFMEKDEIKEGTAVLELYRKPANYKRKNLHLLTVKPLFLHLKLTINT